jgi:peptide deformylase
MIRKIVGSCDPCLRKISRPVEKIDKKVLSLIQDLKDTLIAQKDPEGVGLAAPQLGKNLQIFAINYKNVQRVVINPEILEIKELKNNKKSKKPGVKIMEGCLSLPNYYSPIKRASLVKLKYLDENGKEVVEDFKNFYAQIVLHEVDHLKGTLFVDRLLEQKKKLYKLEKDEWEEVELA